VRCEEKKQTVCIEHVLNEYLKTNQQISTEMFQYALNNESTAIQSMLNDNIIQSTEYNMNVNLPIKGTIENDVMKYFFSNHFIVNNAMVRKNINLEANNDKKYRISMQTFIIKMNHNCGSDDYMDAI